MVGKPFQTKYQSCDTNVEAKHYALMTRSDYV